MIDDLELLRRARPDVVPPSEEMKASARGALDNAMGQRKGRTGPRPRLASGFGLVVPALGALVAVAVVVVFLGLHSQQPTSAGGRPGTRLVFRPLANRQHPVTPATMGRTLLLVRRRLDALLPGARAVSNGRDLIVTTKAATHANTARVVATVENESLLSFYDWEADALTPGGLPVAALLQRHNPSAIEISQGSTAAPPGTPRAGGLRLYAAVRLAAQQPRWLSATNSRRTPEYFLFAASGSRACAAAARYHYMGAHGQHCYLAGPQPSRSALGAALPPGISLSEPGVQQLTVRRGWVVLRAIPQRFGEQSPWSDPTLRYYVLRDSAALSSLDLINVRQSTDQTGAPNVSFGFTTRGGQQFEALTSRVARRGQLVSGLGQRLFQHFAVALENQLLTVPYIDFDANPDGIPGNSGADIQGGFTTRTARQLAAEVTPLPVLLKLVAAHDRG